MENVNEQKEKDKPGGMHELVFSPEAEERTAKTERVVLGRYHHFPRFRSIRFNLWLTFVFMTVTMLAIMWVYELIFYSTLYVYFEENEMSSAGQRLAAGYVEYSSKNPNILGGFIDDFAVKEGVDIVVFVLDENGDASVRYAATPTTGVTAGGLDGVLLDYYLGKLTDYNVGFVANTVNIDGIVADMVVYGFCTVVDREDVYIYMSAALPSFGQARNTLIGQLAVITALCLVISVFVAYFGSGIAARPMRDLTVRVMHDSRGKRRAPLQTNTKLSEINELSAAFNKAFDDVESNNRFRRDLLANVSHDMKTPLTMIRAYSEMIRDISGGNKEKCAKQAQVIIDETDRLTSLIGEVIELSKLEAGVLELHYSTVDISAKLRSTVYNFGIMEEAKGYVFKTEIDRRLLVRADGDRIDRVIYNLLGNAMNYTGEDKTVTVRCRARGKAARIEVLDSGKGMTEEELATVWDKYYRLVQDKRRVVGSGLGLSIVKSILDLHGATFGVASEKGKGSNFWFELPFAEK